MDRNGRGLRALQATLLLWTFLVPAVAFGESNLDFLARSAPQPSAPFRKSLLESPAPFPAQIFAIAEWYYAKARKDASVEERVALARTIVWSPDFTGRTVNRAQAALLSNPAALLVGCTDLKGIYLAQSAAVFALDVKNATYAGNLATAIVTYSEDASGKPLAEIVGASRPYVDNASTLYEYALALKLADPFVDFDALPLLLNYGHLCIDAERLDKAKALFSAALAISPDYPPAREGMAAYWLAKGDKAAAEKALGDRLPTPYRKTAEVSRETTEQKTPEAEAGDDQGTIENKLAALRETPTVLATDFYENIAPDAAADARRFVESQAAELKYTPPGFSALAQYSTLKVFRGRQGQSAMKAFRKEFERFAKTYGKAAGPQAADVLASVGLKVSVGGMSMEDAMKLAADNPKAFKARMKGQKARVDGLDDLRKKAETMKRDMRQADADSRRGEPGALQSIAAGANPELAIFGMKPRDFANPTDLLVQKYNMWLFQKKFRGYKLLMAKESEFVREELATNDKKLREEMRRLKDAMAEELRQLDEWVKELERQQKYGPHEQDEFKIRAHGIHQSYHPRMNNLNETVWMDGTNLVNARYVQRVKPHVERMYADLMRHCLLISDPKIRDRVDGQVSTEVYAAVIDALGNVAGAYAVFDTGYPFECDCNEAEVEAARARRQADYDAAQAAEQAATNRARKEFEQGIIKETSQLYKNLDRYSAEYSLLFMHAKWHPLKTELSYKIPGADFKMVEDHVRNMTTYGGGLTAKLESKGAVGGSVSLGLRGEATVDGKWNVVSSDVTAKAAASATVGVIEGTAAFEVSSTRGSKVSGEVARVYNTQAFAGAADDLRGKMEDVMGITGEEKPKKILWSGEYQLTK